ncbi:MAG: hypothetical protein AB1349_03820 [Elusimicrobiota bacterium]
MKRSHCHNSKFRRSIDDHANYYRKKSIKEKLVETLLISEFCRNLAEAGKKVKFSGK